MPGRHPDRTTSRLAFVTLLVCGGLAIRGWVTGSSNLAFLPWNIFLAWTPYWTSLGIESLARRTQPGTGILVLPTALWLLFFPNAPYIVTDLVHLKASAPAHFVMDILVITSFAALGATLGVLSLQRIHAVVAERLGARAGWIFAGSVFLLAGIGVWMGRVLRWNSWDLLTNPMGIATTTLHALLTPWDHFPAVAFTLLFALVFVGLYRCLPRGSRA